MQALTDRLPTCLDTKMGLAQLKEVLKDVKSEIQNEPRQKMLILLVSRYLDCPTKLPAKRVLSSFFQGLEEDSQQCVKEEICSQLQGILDKSYFQIETARHTVGTISVLMENFKLGEVCLSSIALSVIKYLAEVGHKFYAEVHADVPPVFLNEVMHHCHVTIQTLNLVLQKTVVDKPDLLTKFVNQTDLLQTMWDLDTAILANELFLLDCRCCCAMNAVLILQLSLPCQDAAYQIPQMLIPSSAKTCTLPSCLSWLTEAKAGFLDIERMSTLTALVVAFGYIAMVNPMSVVHRTSSGSYFYLHMFLPALLKQLTRCNDTTSRTLFGKTISLFATKLLECVQKIDLPTDFIQDINGDSTAMQSLLGYVWTNWEDQLDIVRQSAKVTFEKVLQLHLIFRSRKDIRSITVDPFLQSLVLHLFTVSWTSRGKFSALTSYVRHLGCQPLLEVRPGLPEEVIQQLQEQALSCYASELYCTMFTSHKQEVGNMDTSFEVKENLMTAQGRSKDQAADVQAEKNTSRIDAGGQLSLVKFYEMWVEPVTKAMCASKKKLKQNIVEYLLPRLMKSGHEVLSFMIQGLSKRLKDQPQQSQGAIIMCLHRARTLGFLKPSMVENENETLWLGYLSADVLRETLCNMDDYIRLDAFALVCENSKTSEVVSPIEFEMLKFFIPHNVNNQSPAFRQAFLALLKKFLFRVKESLLSLRRKLKGKNSLQSIDKAIGDYESFLRWVAMLTVDNLYPGAAFARRTTSLAILSQLTISFSSVKDGFCVPILLKKPHLQALLECLTDTFEDNKREALGVLTSFLRHQDPIWDHQGTAETLGTALALACSTRPQDCDTAVYILLVLLKQQEFYHHKFDFAALLSSASGATDLNDPTLSTCPKLLLLWALLQALDSQIGVAEKSLVSAAASKPMYPTLHCIRYILQEIDFSTLDKDHMLSAKDFIKRLITSCLHLSRVVSPVVQNSSPEGNVPEETMADADIPNAEWSRALVESMPEYLVVCGWRSIKEVSLTLGSLCLQLPTKLIVKEEEDGGLLSLQQVEVIGKYFNQQLLESIHRGAFELAYAGFQLMCQMLWRHPVGCFHQLPCQWLSAVLQDIKSGDPQSRLCATRRSAGVPFLVQAITSTEPNLTGRQTFHSAMTELLRLALNQDEISSEKEVNTAPSSDAQVHSLNILRALYRESRLGDDVVSYVADGLKAAILGFRSEQWAVRNSATLLLSSLMTRMFGVKRSKDETAMSKKNCQTGRAFFYRYPTLYPFLLSELKAATANVMSKDRLSLHPSLYPVLLVLGRLFPSTLEGSDTSLSLSAFIPFVIRCASSPVYKTRVIASRAIQPLAKRNEVIGISSSLWDNLPLSPLKERVQSSLTHGSLLQLTQLVELVEDFHETYRLDALESFVENLTMRKWIFERLNPCFATRQAALILTDHVLDIADACLTDTGNLAFEISVGKLRQSFVSAISDHMAHDQCKPLPFFFEFEKTRAQLCLKHLTAFERYDPSSSHSRTVGKDIDGINPNSLPEAASTTQSCKDNSKPSHLREMLGSEAGNTSSLSDQMLLSLLKSPVYDVRLGVLDVLLSSIVSSKTNGQSDSLKLAHGGIGPDDQDLELTSQAQFVSIFIQGAEAVVFRLKNQLLKMAMETETHHLCVEKVFYLLASLPDIFTELDKESSNCLSQMLSTLIERVQAERRTEVKAAMMRFSVRLVAVLYKRAPEPHNNDSVSRVSFGQDEIASILINWLNLLRESSSADENPELQISCCHCLLQNADILLADPLNIFGRNVYTVWNTLAMLLQDDDMEVKEIAASVICVILKKEPGSYQSSYALHMLPSVLISFHGSRDVSGVLHCLVSWILQDSSVDVKESNERLFDKGEMNTYLDHVAFTRSIIECFEKIISSPNISQDRSHHHSDPETNSNVDFYHQSYLECQKDQDFVSFLDSCVMSLVGDIRILESSCRSQDMFMNVARFSSLCQTMHKGQLCLSLFHKLAPETEVLTKSLDTLDKSMAAIKANLNLTNILCA